ncbi:glycosyl transferase group 1 [Dethiosulfovibrio peptidovorans DSM 11002]|uniref:Glycosyl transferase group 1 n=1 Tax=Dethiosulfovibrio peptidovorans DSM 11002 TaxID=469381 RepID=D2Z5Q8_9BACT|nr:glycosyltransferase [Dethiosulfovibrio peptidovorans]EFC90805.1 glycosyl transferase group 1 [Dethiosulfovibrio peptidovorans DSM 11002]
MKKITHITSVHPREDTRIFIKECSSLAQNGYKVSLVVADNKGNENRNRISIVDAGAKEKSRSLRIIKTARKVVDKAIATKADLYHIHDPELLLFSKKLLKHGKVIYDAHEDVPRQILSKGWIPRPLRRPLSFITEKVENHYVKRLNGVVTATPFIKKRFIKINTHSIDINNYPKLKELGDIEHASEKKRLICYVGGISTIRGIFEMVQAMQYVNGKLLLAGSFSNQKERDLVKTFPGWRKVIELGYCDRKKVKKILSLSRAGLVVLRPTINYIDALPVKLFEYMASEIPVVASSFPLWIKIVSSSKCGICVNPLNPKEIGKAINWILDNPKKAASMGRKGRKATQTNYNWETESKKLLNFYRNVVASPTCQNRCRMID